MRVWQYVVEIWEADETRFPVVVHIFPGLSQASALGTFRAHMKTDEFLAGMVERGVWNGIRGRVQTGWTQR